MSGLFNLRLFVERFYKPVLSYDNSKIAERLLNSDEDIRNKDVLSLENETIILVDGLLIKQSYSLVDLDSTYINYPENPFEVPLGKPIEVGYDMMELKTL